MREEKIKKVTNVIQAIFIVTENAQLHMLSDTSDTSSDIEKSNTKMRVLNSLESAALDTLDTYYKQSANWTKDMSRTLNYIRTLISLAQQVEIVSVMNAQVLEKGVDFILTSLEEKRQDAQRQADILAQENNNRQLELAIDLHVDNVSETETFDIYQKDVAGKITEVADRVVEKIVEKNIEKPPEKKSQPVHIKDTKQGVTQNRTVAREIESHNRQQNRRQEILDILSDTPISIKDISTHILGCSEKTIQRELNALLSDRRIQKIGEKRWSKYLLR
jgi:AraC-like DNA-binding protein